MLKSYSVKYDPNYPVFGLIGEPHDHKQHQNQQRGLDLYINCVNFDTGERCHKKLYQNNKGLYFKHTGYSTMYLDDFTDYLEVFPFQIMKNVAIEYQDEFFVNELKNAGFVPTEIVETPFYNHVKMLSTLEEFKSLQKWVQEHYPELAEVPK